MDDPYEYQNGGQWDWFGGKLIYAMFEHGFSRQAKEKLLEIARKNIANKGFFEWDNKNGTGQGSDFYAGSAGSLNKVLFEGYLGLKISSNSLQIELKLGRDAAKVHVYIPSADIFVAYDYLFTKEKNRLVFHFNSNFPRPGKIKILSPWGNSRPERAKGRNELVVRKDGVKIPYKTIKIHEDEFILIESDFRKHSLEIGYFRPTE
jgi:hypothetical protein